MTTDLPEDPGPGGAALDALSRALTAPPGDGELSGEAAALAMFRAVRPPGHGPVPRFQRRARTLVAAAGIALAGCTAAAYAAVLPAQVQHAAYQVLGFIGVPDARPGGPSHPRPAAGRPVTSPAPARRGSRSPGSASASSSASNQAGPPGAVIATRLTMGVQHGQIAAGSSDELSAELTVHGRPVAGQWVQVLERDAGAASWRPAGQARTNLAGRAALPVTAITVNTWFRLAGPDQTQSPPALIVVIPPVSLGLTAGSAPRTAVLTVSCRYATLGDIVLLQVRNGGGWLSVRSHQLGPDAATKFTLRVPAAGRLELRAVVLPTVTHGPSASEPITLAPS